MITYIFYIYKSYFFKFSLTTGRATPLPFCPLFIVTMFFFDDLNISQQLTRTINVNKADNIRLHIPGQVLCMLGDCVDFKNFRLMFMTSKFKRKEE